MLKLQRVSPLTGKTNEMVLDVTEEQLSRWANGELIQNVMPDLTPSEREFIMTGYTDEDWTVMFPPDTCEGCGFDLSDYEIDVDLHLCRTCRAENEMDDRGDLARESRYEHE